MSGLLSPCKSWSQPTGDATKLQRLQRLQGPFPPAGLQSRKKLYPPSASHLAGVEGVVVGGGGETGVKGKKEAGPKSDALFLPGVDVKTKKSRKNCISLSRRRSWGGPHWMF